jgi:hypothetical protein
VCAHVQAHHSKSVTRGDTQSKPSGQICQCGRRNDSASHRPVVSGVDVRICRHPSRPFCRAAIKFWRCRLWLSPADNREPTATRLRLQALQHPGSLVRYATRPAASSRSCLCSTLPVAFRVSEGSIESHSATRSHVHLCSVNSLCSPCMFVTPKPGSSNVRIPRKVTRFLLEVLSTTPFNRLCRASM